MLIGGGNQRTETNSQANSEVPTINGYKLITKTPRLPSVLRESEEEFRFKIPNSSKREEISHELVNTVRRGKAMRNFQDPITKKQEGKTTDRKHELSTAGKRLLSSVLRRTSSVRRDDILTPRLHKRQKFD